MLLARREDFEPANPTEGASALYYSIDGVGYREYQFFQLRIDALKGRFAPNNQKLAIWGCGWGYLVNLAVQAGYDAFGYDASSYAITKAKALFPTLAARFFLRSALVSGDMTPARRDAGLQGAQRFALLVTEDMLTCFTDVEITTSLTNLRGICSTNLGHIVTPLDPWNVERGTADPRINWKTYDQWKALLTPPDYVIGQNGETV